MKEDFEHVQLRKHGQVFILTLLNEQNENRFNQPLLTSLIGALNEVERVAGDSSVLVTTSKGKYFSNGLDLRWMKEHQHETEKLAKFSSELLTFVARMLCFPIPTIALLNGHCYGASCFFALAHDYQIMSSEKGWFRVPSIQLGITLPVALLELARFKLSPKSYRDLVLGGKKYTGKEAVEAKILDLAVPTDKLEAQLQELTAKLLSNHVNKQTYGATKRGMYAKVYEALTTDPGTTLYSKL